MSDSMDLTLSESKAAVGIPAFFSGLWQRWGALVSGTFSVPFWAFALFADSTAGKIGWCVMAVIALLFAHFQTWSNLNKRISELENRLSEKIKLSLPEDPFKQTTGIEFAEGVDGRSLPYVQVCAEPNADAAIFEPVANIIRIDHRNDDASVFSEVMGEPEIAGWSRQPANVHLSKGKPIRFNVFSYNENGMCGASPIPSYKVNNAYQKIGKQGEYRYKVHVDGRNTVPTEAYVFVKWGIRGHPQIRLEKI
jgi:hypothetical protein